MSRYLVVKLADNTTGVLDVYARMIRVMQGVESVELALPSQSGLGQEAIDSIEVGLMLQHDDHTKLLLDEVKRLKEQEILLTAGLGANQAENVELKSANAVLRQQLEAFLEKKN